MNCIIQFLHVTFIVCIWIMYVNIYVCVLPVSQFVLFIEMFTQSTNKYAGVNKQLCSVCPTIMHNNDKINVNS